VARKDVQHTHSPSLNRWPARLDAFQSLSGLILVLFMWVHMCLVSSILLGEEAMYTVSRFFEGAYVFDRPYPVLVSTIAGTIFVLIVLHGLTAIRKTPTSYAQYRTFYFHMQSFKHTETNLWFIQVITGFVLMFLVGIHLFQMFSEPAGIGPYASSDRIWSENFWPLYLVILFSVELHAGIGLFRLILKWGWFNISKQSTTRKKLQRIKWMITLFFLAIGLVTLAAYMKLGINHGDHVGERYQSISVQYPADDVRQRIISQEHINGHQSAANQLTTEEIR